jgi:PKD repeat protein
MSGSYIVQLTVTDDTGETDTDVTTVPIGIGNLPPKADAGAPVTGSNDVAVSFDGTNSRDLNGSIVKYTWDFGDGTTGDGPTPSHTYSTRGRYNVILTVTDDDGAADADTTAADINEIDLPSIARSGSGGNCFIMTAGDR